MKLSVVLYTSKTLSDGSHPIMLRLFRKGKYFYKSLQISCKESDWNDKDNLCRKSFQRHANFNKIIRESIAEVQSRIDNMLANKSPFVIDDIFISTEKDEKTLVQVIEEHRAQYVKYNTLLKYNKLINKLNEYGFSNTSITDVDALLIKTFYNKIKDGRADNTIYTYMAVFEASLSSAVEKGYISENPFKYTKFKYDKSTIKRALSRNDIDHLIAYFNVNYNPSDCPFDKIKSEEYALNLFICAYYLQGLSLIDLANLKVKDVVLSKKPVEVAANFRKMHERNETRKAVLNKVKELAENKQEKTKQFIEGLEARVLDENIEKAETTEVYTIDTRRSKTNKAVRIIISTTEARDLLFLNKLNKSPDDYLFNIFNEDCEGNEKYKIYRLTYVTNQVNTTLRAIAKNLKLELENLTLYCARHTYASVLYHNGISPSLIAQNLGRDMRNIDVYLKQFDDENIINANQLL